MFLIGEKVFIKSITVATHESAWHNKKLYFSYPVETIIVQGPDNIYDLHVNLIRKEDTDLLQFPKGFEEHIKSTMFARLTDGHGKCIKMDDIASILDIMKCQANKLTNGMSA